MFEWNGFPLLTSIIYLLERQTRACSYVTGSNRQSRVAGARRCREQRLATGGVKLRAHQVQRVSQSSPGLTLTRYSFTSRLLCTNQPSFHPPVHLALPTLVQYDCTIIGQYTTPPPNSRVYAICYTPYNIGNNNNV